MSIIEIDPKTCTKCGICAAECPRRIITMPEGSLPQAAASEEASCNACGHCVAVCPKGSLSHRDSPLETSPKIDKGLKVTPEQVEQLLKGRRSARVFRDRPVSREIITRLIEAARYAPTGHNLQEVEWLVIDNKKELDRIEELGIEWLQWVIKNLPQVATASNMEEKLERQKLKHDAFLRGAPVLIVAHANKNSLASLAGIDSANALSYLELAANSLGLGTCWAGYVYIMANTFPPVQKALALPEDHAAYGCMMLGYNRFRYYRIPCRKVPRITWR
ncbi:MAG: nitroreductase family protein [Dehalococcoidia bacterium]|nr:nitroreductase family protein [Dehalococcoidia bacterium]